MSKAGKLCAVFLSAASLVLYAQGDRGTITGSILDPAGAVVPAAPVEIRNVDNGAVYQAGSSSTGNYTLAQIPAGKYELSVVVPGFKRYVRTNLEVGVAQTIRVDVPLEVGGATESVTITEAAPLLKTESGELSHNVTTDRMNNLPVLAIGATASGLRNPYSAMQLVPGTSYTADSVIRVNGMIGNSQSMRVEGQDASNRISSSNQSVMNQSVDAIQEVAIQTSNFAAEFGQAGGGVFNVTMKSGTNQYHGGAFEYFVNEGLNAGQPFTDNGNNELIRNRQRRHDFGFTFGGPVKIPKIYNGRDRSFFFFNFERFQEDNIVNNRLLTVPTADYRLGNFASARPANARTLGTDPLGRPIIEGTIYDPLTDRVVGTQRVRDAYPNNVIPTAAFDPVSAKIQSYIPLPNAPGLVNNYRPLYVNPNRSNTPSVKIDHSLSSRSKISGFWSRLANFSPNPDGLPQPITTSVPRDNVSNTYRINYDHTISPTMLGHIGVGFIRTVVFQPGTEFDVVNELGLRGTNTTMFPNLAGLSNAQGGSGTMGSGNQNRLDNTKPTANLSLTWVKGNHTYKFGAEMIVEGFTNATRTYANGWMVFANTETSLPSTNGQNLNGGTIGFPYASFLLGGVNNGRISTPTKTRMGSHAFSGFAQDTWKVTRKLTLDYGIRYDFQTYLREQYGRAPLFAPNLPNPTAGGLPGDVAFEGYGGGRCNCDVAHNYPYAFGPRIGIAYQIDSKTVLRFGTGISYNRTDNNNNISYSIGSLRNYVAPSFGDPAYNLRDGVPYKITWPDFSPGQFPLPGNLGAPQVAWDAQAGRPARIFQWSIGLQRQVTKDLVVEAAYVGNRGAWWSAPLLLDVNALTQSRLRAYGLDVENAADRTLLATPLNQPLAQASRFATPPYAGFPLGSTVAQSLRPFPQFTGIQYRYSPLGKTWYDSLQMKVTKRYSHGLDFTGAFTFQREFTLGAENEFSFFGAENPQVNDVYNRNLNKYISGYSQPFTGVFAANYTTPRWNINRVVSQVVRDWTLGAVMQYASGKPIRVPAANSALATYLFRGTFANRVEGQPLFTQDLNCHCYDPNTQFTLNRAAWADPAPGTFASSTAYYNDYREQRRPRESMSIARNFRFGHENRMNLQVRAEFTNIFNRTFVVDPVSTNAAQTQTTSGGKTTGGFGWINTSSVAAPPRQGQLVARFSF